MIADESYLGQFELWDSGTEPEASCSACGWRARRADWPTESGIYFGAPIQTFWNWPELASEFVEQPRSRVGTRTVTVLGRL